jgi:hypothetical protein
MNRTLGTDALWGEPPTIHSTLAFLAPGAHWDDLVDWPPDVFAFTESLLAQTEVYRLVASPPPGRDWPPSPDWNQAVVKTAEEWAAWVTSPQGEPPTTVRQSWETLSGQRRLPLEPLSQGDPWDLCEAIFTLHSLADEARKCLPTCGLTVDSGFASRAWELLATVGSLSRFPASKIRVFPKTQVASGGLTVRSLSRYLCAFASPVGVRWTRVGAGTDGAGSFGNRSYNMLLLPWPLTVRRSDFTPTSGPLRNMPKDADGFFQFDPSLPLDFSYVRGALQQAVRDGGHVEAVVLPESAVLPEELQQLEDLVAEYGVSFLVSGVRERVEKPGKAGRNYAHFGARLGSDWFRGQQDKHHRWLLDPNQIRQYQLGGALDAQRRWWEAIGIPPRGMNILDVGGGSTPATLICEDLARLDDVSELVRAIGPTLVVAILLDGPQLRSRWSARYASVLADDPGSSVLTLTSLGMARRCRPPGYRGSRVVASWKDTVGGLREIELARGADAILLSTSEVTRTMWTADVRNHTSADLLLDDVRQIRTGRQGATRRRPGTGNDIGERVRKG